MFILNAKLALITFLVYPFIYFWIRFFIKKLKKIAERVNESRSMLTAKINEVINGIQILQIFNFKKQTVDEFNEINTEYTKEQLKDVKLREDIATSTLTTEDAVKNAKETIYDEVKVPKVVGEGE